MTRTGPVRVGIVGAGDISGAYIESLRAFPDLEVRAVASRDPARAARRAAEFGIEGSGGITEVIADPQIELIVNLTVPAAHLQVSLAALEAGKHVWSEKPFALDRDGARRLLSRADQLGLRIASAPDTFLGAPSQAFRSAVSSGDVGIPSHAVASYETAGPEVWHPNPAFLYDTGAGPLFDIGPYFVTELVHCLGSVARVSASGVQTSTERIVGSGLQKGTAFPVRVPTTVLALLEFRSGAIGHLKLSFDGVSETGGRLEVWGSKGHVAAVDPRMFELPATLTRRGSDDAEAKKLPLFTTPYRRGLGVLDLARSIRAGTPERTSGALAAHVLDVLAAIDDAARDHLVGEVASQAPAVPLLTPGWDPDAATL